MQGQLEARVGVQNCWEALLEDIKRRILTSYLKMEPAQFAKRTSWMKVRPETVAQRKYPEANRNFDKHFTVNEDGKLARSVLMHLFLSNYPSINRRFLSDLLNAHKDSPEDSVTALVNSVLDNLKSGAANADSPLVDLYCATLKWMYPEYFSDSLSWAEVVNRAQEAQALTSVTNATGSDILQVAVKTSESCQPRIDNVLDNRLTIMPALTTGGSDGQTQLSSCNQLLEHIHNKIVDADENYAEFSKLCRTALDAKSTEDLGAIFKSNASILTVIESKAKSIMTVVHDITEQVCKWECQGVVNECLTRNMLIEMRKLEKAPLQSLRSQASTLRSVSERMKADSTTLLNNIKQANSEFVKMAQELGENQDNIAIPENILPICLLRLKETEVLAIKRRVQDELEERLIVERKRITHEVESISARYRQLPAEYTVEIDAVTNQLYAANTLSQLSQLNDTVSRLTLRAASDVQLLDIHSLVAEFDLKYEPRVLFALAARLINQSALIPALRLIQWATTTVCPNIASCGNEGVGRLILHALICGLRENINITSVVLDIPILQSATLLHISEPVLREQIAFTLVVTALKCKSNALARAFHHVYAEPLHRFITWAKACATFARGEMPVLTTGTEESACLSLRTDLLERVRRENGLYVHLQCRNTKFFQHFESEAVLPMLAEILQSIEGYLNKELDEQALSYLGSLDPNRIYSKLTKNFRLPVQDHSHYTKILVNAIGEFLALCTKYTTETLRLRQRNFLSTTALRAEVRAWATEREIEKTSLGQIDILLDAIDLKEGHNAHLGDARACFPETLACEETLAKKFPRLRKLYFGVSGPSQQESLDALLDDIRNTPVEPVVSVDFEQGVYGAASSEDSSEGSEMREEVEARRPIIELRAIHDLKLFDSLIEAHRFGAAMEISKSALVLEEEHALQRREADYQTASTQLDHLLAIKDVAERADVSCSWREDAYELCDRTERVIRARRSGVLDADMCTLADLVSAMQFAVSNPDFGFDEVKRALRELDCGRVVAGDSLAVLPIREQALSLFDSWQSLCMASSAERNKVWQCFCKRFAEYCGLYHELFETLTVRKDNTAYSYPFYVFQTAFRRPRCQYLNRPVMLHFYAPESVRQSQLQDLVNEVCSDDAMQPHHLVFCSTANSDMQTHLGDRFRHVSFLPVDIEELCRSMKPDAMIRTRLYRSADNLSACSPFSSEGYVHKDNGLFVGRRNVLRELETNRHVALWGGRKVGKTSLLHAYAQGLKLEGFEVAYVYADTHDDSTDPDLALAARICRSLSFPEPSTLSEFERCLQDARLAGRRLAFLVDEVDEYIKASCRCHEARFPFASKLRQACMEDTSGSTRLVYAGYHQLYSEAHPREARRVAHPFVNIAKEIRLGDLKASEVRELVVCGFEDLLGVTCCPDAPRIIWSYASGHPAFIQQFCSLLVDLVDAKRRRGGKLEVTVGDIERIYKQNEPDDIVRKPFICYVEEVLGWNLTCLGRAVVIILADRLRELRRPDDSELQTKDLIAHICNWSSLSGVTPPLEDHVRLTLDLLQMTNILRFRGETLTGYVSFRFPVYVDILYRLGQLEQPQSDIARLLKEYDRTERREGVLR